MFDLQPGQTRTRLYRVVVQMHDDESYGTSVTDLVQYLHPVTGLLVSEETSPREESLDRVRKLLADAAPDILLSNFAQADDVASLRAQLLAASDTIVELQDRVASLTAEKDAQVSAAVAVIEEQERRMTQGGEAVPVGDFGYSYE